jgi:hypothetical protein
MAQCIVRSLSWLAPCKHHPQLHSPAALFADHSAKAKTKNVPVETIPFCFF